MLSRFFSQKLISIPITLTLFATILSSSACQKKLETTNGLIGEALMADRPAVEKGSQVFLIELKSEPLASSAQKNAQGILEVDPELLKVIEAEQKEAESTLQGLSSDVKVLFRYKHLLNAIAVVAPVELKDKIQKLPFVQKLQPRRVFPQPKVRLQLNPMAAPKVSKSVNSVTHIEAQAAYDLGIRGKGIRVGVLDTGLDFTHSMLGGTGNVEDYKQVDPNGASAHFPNKKVVGGIDLVGTRFDAASLDPSKRIPIPDANPMDEGGHGSHVAGSIAGLGDGVNTYDGVAPEADLYAIKVFGSGSTSDEVVIAGLEWALDPNQDGHLDDQLHVVNLSLGGGNGTPFELYNKAVTNLTRVGTVMVASAGNDSDIPFIVGSPSTSDDALSVAAQIDGSEHNWRFKTVGFYLGETRIALAEAMESAISKPINEVESAMGPVVFGGLADKDYTEEEAQEIKGRILLVDRGVVTFQEKMQRAEKAGAIAVIVAQNKPEAPFTMGGDGKVEIPAVMISQELGQKLKEELDKGNTVTANFKNPDLIEKPELIGQITDFSSRGPRSYDLLLKPEITAPGQNIISAAMGEGNKAVQMSGTSMSGPHMAGVMALMKQKYQALTTRELKSVVMGTAIQVKDAKGNIDSVARQGAGQVLVSRALKAQFVTEPSAFSLGFQQIEKEKKLAQSLRLKSLGDDEIQLKVRLETSSSAISLPEQTLTLKPQGLTDVKLPFTLRASALAGLEEEVTGWVVLQHGEWVQKIPFLVRLHKISNIKLTKAEMGSGSPLDAEGSEANLEFTNKGSHSGDVWAFNLIGLDAKKDESSSPIQSSECDIKAVGYRIVQAKLEVAVKLHKRLTSWPLCEMSVLLDKDGDKKPEAELALTPLSRVAQSGDQIVSTLLDFKKAQQLRDEAEEEAKASDESVELNLAPAILAQDTAIAGDLRSAAILQVALADLKAVAGMNPRIQVIAASNDSRNVETDDYLKDEKHWTRLSLNPQDQGWTGLRNWTLQAGQTQKVEILRGAARNALLIMYPQNSLDSRGLHDDQLQVFKPRQSTEEK